MGSTTTTTGIDARYDLTKRSDHGVVYYRDDDPRGSVRERPVCRVAIRQFGVL